MRQPEGVVAPGPPKTFTARLAASPPLLFLHHNTVLLDPTAAPPRPEQTAHVRSDWLITHVLAPSLPQNFQRFQRHGVLTSNTTKLAGLYIHKFSFVRPLLGPKAWVYGGDYKKPP
ncbi:hypothetical protein PMIN01_07906 [Paraphaeosphaeria minitans]|uniref:Uncharacterized protein n=1 Tax=Paraphaeosphaeria minitans TaxID=565426 RepID=A0A9P6GE02_9PLEO|nr:hypothetical protein PMIN01_07906 [Paraphaeosphaeria minitans]